MKGMFLPVFAVLGMSLFSIWPGAGSLPFTIAISDILTVLLLIYALIKVRLLELNTISTATILLAVVLLISGIYNMFSFPKFDLTNFSFNYFRVIGLVAMVLFLPPVLRRIGQDRLARGTMWVIRLHCGLLFLDAFHLIPMEWLPGVSRSARPAGFFYEPGWFGTWVGLSVFYVLQVQRNRKHQYISYFDIAFMTVAVISSAGMRGIVFLGLAMVTLLIGMGKQNRLKLIGGVLLIVMVFTFAGKKMPVINWGDGRAVYGLARVKLRLLRINPANIKDDSVLDRLASTAVGAMYVLDESPLLGIGLGRNNQQRLPWYSRIEGVSGSSMMLTSIFLAGGLLGLVVYLFILIKMLAVPETRVMGIGFSLAAFTWGGAYDSFIWWFIALSVALMNTRKFSKVVPLENNLVRENP